MARVTLFAATAALTAGLAFSVGQAFGQGAKDLQGTWTIVSVETTSPDGKKSQTFGSDPQGLEPISKLLTAIDRL